MSSISWIWAPHVIIHVQRYILVKLLEGCLVHYLYLMLDQSSFAQVQVTAGKQVFPFGQQLSGLFLLQFRPLLEALEVPGLQDLSLLGLVIGFIGSPCWEDYWWHLVGRGYLSKHSLVEISMESAPKLCRQMDTLDDPRCSSP